MNSIVLVPAMQPPGKTAKFITQCLTPNGGFGTGDEGIYCFTFSCHWIVNMVGFWGEEYILCKDMCKCSVFCIRWIRFRKRDGRLRDISSRSCNGSMGRRSGRVQKWRHPRNWCVQRHPRWWSMWMGTSSRLVRCERKRFSWWLWFCALNSMLQETS